MYTNDDQKRVVVERKQNLFSRIFSTRKKRINGKKDSQIQFIVPYTPAPPLSSKQVSQSSVVSFGEYFSSNNSLSYIPPVVSTENINCNTPAPPLSSKQESQSSVVSFGEYFSRNNSLNYIPPVSTDTINYNTNVEPSLYNSNDSITEKRLNSSSLNLNNNSNVEYPYINKNNSFYIKSVVVNNKTQSSGDNFKRYLKSITRSRKNKTFISVTSTANNTTTTTTTLNPTSKDLQSLPNIINISNVSSTYSVPSISQLSQISQSNLNNNGADESNKENVKKGDISISKSKHQDRKLALDKIITKLRKVQNQQKLQEEGENRIMISTEPRQCSSPKNFEKSYENINEYFNNNSTHNLYNNNNNYKINNYKNNHINYNHNNHNNKNHYNNYENNNLKLHVNNHNHSHHKHSHSHHNHSHSHSHSHNNNHNNNYNNNNNNITNSHYDINPKRSSFCSSNNSSFYIPHNTASSNYEMISRKRMSLRSNYSRIASIDCSNTHINEDRFKPPIKSVSSHGLQKMESSTHSIDLNFNSDDTLTASQYLSQSSNNITAIGDSNATIQDILEEERLMEDELDDSMNKLSLQDQFARRSSNPTIISETTEHHRPKTIASFRIHKSNNSLEASELPNNTSDNEDSSTNYLKLANTSTHQIPYRYPRNLKVANTSTHQIPYRYPRNRRNSSSANRSTSVTFANIANFNKPRYPHHRHTGAMSVRCYIADEAIAENSDETDEDIDIDIKEETEESTIPIPRKPKSLFNESVFSYSSSVNQIRNDLKMEKVRSKRRRFSNIFSRDYDFYLREKIKNKLEEYNRKSNNTSCTTLHRVNSRAYSVKETDSIYLKSDEPGNVSLPSLKCMTEGKVNQYYFIKELDSGSYGRVYLVYDENINEYFACKVISKSRLKRNFRFAQVARRRNFTPSIHGEAQNIPCDPLESIKKEVAIFKKMTKHPNIVLLVEVLDDAREDNIYMVFELCEKGKVMDIQVNKKTEPFTEEKARKYFREVVLGLEYCHYMKIIHRDIKPDNLLLTADDTIKISDFGISHMFNENQDDTISDKNASPLYCPPEACSSEIATMKGKAVDIWALGITLYCFVHGYCPFEDTDVINLCKKIEEDPVEYSPTISPELKDLLSKMLQKDPNKRITIPEIKQHSWVTENSKNPMMSTEENCIYEEITDEEIQNAVQPAFMFVSKLLKKIKKGITQRSENRRRNYSVSINYDVNNEIQDDMQYNKEKNKSQDNLKFGFGGMKKSSSSKRSLFRHRSNQNLNFITNETTIMEGVELNIINTSVYH